MDEVLGEEWPVGETELERHNEMGGGWRNGGAAEGSGPKETLGGFGRRRSGHASEMPVVDLCALVGRRCRQQNRNYPIQSEKADLMGPFLWVPVSSFGETDYSN